MRRVAADVRHEAGNVRLRLLSDTRERHRCIRARIETLTVVLISIILIS